MEISIIPYVPNNKCPKTENRSVPRNSPLGELQFFCHLTTIKKKSCMSDLRYMPDF